MIHQSITELIGSTPLLELSRLEEAYSLKGRLVAKMESQNPAGSAKDRVALSMIEAAERAGALTPGSVIIEPTSGNTGVGLAAIAARRGYRVILTMPETMSVERQALLRAYGAELGIDTPLKFFWATGALSSFLDNSPTYVVFLTAAGSLGAGGATAVATTVGAVASNVLLAISAGAVFMGAMTYIGNAPNFMVKSISDENGIHMPSFFGYMFWSVRFLIPIFVLDTLIFFW